ncbi:HlyD family type I secretion periplasmic adaptor subunit [Crenothrix sp.]|uniref:HlyD family type I secretion periplasmic adaptor subunit n=1 Tax=Crenothrix sp. TaxID=3100433 RepID=UPI00374DBB78
MSLLINPAKKSNAASLQDPAQADLVRFSDDRPVRYLGYCIILFVFVFLGGWAYWAPLGSAALAPGSIKVEGEHKTVQHLEGGIVKAIHIHNGDMVSKGQILIELEDTSSKAQLQTLRGQFFSALAREARLISERDGKAAINYPESLKNENKDVRAQEAMRVQTQSFVVRRQSRQGQIGILKEQHQQLLAKIEGIKSQKFSRNNLANSLNKDLTDMRAMLVKGYVERPKVSELERRLTEAQGDHGNFVADIATAQTQISEIGLKVLQIDKDFQKEVIDELSKVQTELSELREKIEWLNDTVTRTLIKAPEAGMVMNLKIYTVGAVIAPGSQPGQPGEGGNLLDIVPQQEKLIVEARVSPVDIDRVHIGQSTEVRFSAFKSAKTPKVDGRLMKLSADIMLDERNQQQPSYYLAKVEVDKAGLEELRKRGLILMPGMPAEVLINTGDRTFFEYLAQPFSNIFARSLIED